MSFAQIKYEKEDGIATITLNRPEKLNPIGVPMRAELRAALEDAEEDENIRVVVIKGAGRAFSAGADVAIRGSIGPPERDPVAFYSYGTSSHKLFYFIGTMRKPIIAAVHGYCLGFGLELSLECDFLVASEDALFGEPEINLAAPYGLIRLPKLIGEKKATLIAMTGELINAKEADRLGMVSLLVPREKLDEAATELAEKLKAKSAVALWFAKLGIRHCPGVDRSTAQVIESLLEAMSIGTPDGEEGGKAFREKRKAAFGYKLPKTAWWNRYKEFVGMPPPEKKV